MDATPTIDDFLADPRALYGEMRNSAAASGILASPEDVQIARVRQAFTRIASFAGHPLQHFYEQAALRKLASALLRHNPAFSEADIEALLMATADAGKAVFPIMFIPLNQLLARVQTYIYLHGMTLKMERLMQELRDTLSTDKVEQRYARTQLNILLGPRSLAEPDSNSMEWDEDMPDAQIIASFLVSEFVNHVDAEVARSSDPSLRTLADVQDWANLWSSELADIPAGDAIASAPMPVRVAALLEAMQQSAHIDWTVDRQRRDRAHLLVMKLIRSPLSYRDQDIVRLLSFLSADILSYHTYLLDDTVWTILHDHLNRNGLSDKCRLALERCRFSLARFGGMREIPPLAHTVNELLGNLRPGLMEPGEQWAETALRDMDGMPETDRHAWHHLISHSLDSPPGKPTKKWQMIACENLEHVGPVPYVERIIPWFKIVSVHDAQVTERNAKILRGLVWHAMSEETSHLMCEPLRALAHDCFTKIPELGARCIVAGNACLAVLESITTDQSTVALTSLLDSISYEPVQEKIAAILKKRGEQTSWVSPREKRRLKEAARSGKVHAAWEKVVREIAERRESEQ